MMRTLLFTLSVLFSGFALTAQQSQPLKGKELEFATIEYGLEDGLPNPGNFDMIIDQKGRIWASTFTGLVCFNGTDFKTYTKEDGLPFNQTLKLFEDDRGRIWMMGFERELHYMDESGVHPYPYNQLIKDSISTAKYVLSFSVDSSGGVYLNLQLGYSFVYIDSSGVLTRLDIEEPVQGLTRVMELGEVTHVQVKEEAGWARKYPDQTIDMKVSVSQGQGKAVPIPSNARVRYNRMTRMESALRLQDGRLLLNTRRGLLGQLKPGGPMELISDERGTIVLFQDSDGWVYEGTFLAGVLIYDPSDLKTPMYHWFPDAGIAKVLEDKEGGIWFATRGQGWKYCPNKHLMNLDKKVETHPWQIGKDKWGNRYQKPPLRSTVEQVDPAGRRREIASFEDGSYLKVMVAPDSSFLLMLVTAGQFIFDPETNATRPGLPFRVQYDLDGRAFSDSLLFFSRGKKIYSLNRWGDTTETPVPIGIVTGVANARGDWFLGNSDGMFRLRDGEATKIFPTDSSRQRVYNIEGNGDTLFAATDDAGLVVWTEDTLFRITEADGFPDNITLGINPIDQTRILAGSQKGIALVYPFEEEKVRALLNQRTGLMDMATASGHVNEDTCILSGAQYTGVIAIADLPKLPELDPPFLDVYQRDSLLDQSKIDFDPNQNEFLFSFFNVSYQHKLLYRYQMLGFDPRWYETESPEVRYPKLPPGNYVFQVESRTAPGYWSGNVQSWSFEVAAPFWATWWFRSVLVLCALALAYWLARKWVQRERRRQEWKQRMVALKNEALRSQMNPHFTFNAMNAIQSFITGRENEKAANYLSSFARLIRMFLELSRSDAVSLEQEMDLLDQYLKLEEMRFPGKVQWSIECDPGLDAADTFLPSLMVQPLVENAVLHGLQPLGKPGWVRIRFTPGEPGLLTCTVWDSGVGKSQSGRVGHGHSVALSIVEERLESLAQSGWPRGATDLYFDREVKPWGKGTAAILKLPTMEGDL